MEAPPQIQAQGELSVNGALPRNEGLSEASQTASEFIDSQLQLEADAREALPYVEESSLVDHTIFLTSYRDLTTAPTL
ncbi:hypothetical protein MMC29_000681 [Sticta canariensis]|nr:hypothetical protein [Sticta canariensis]